MDSSTTSAFTHDPEPTEPGPSEFADFYRRHFAFVWATTRKLGLDLRSAEDAAQEVFVVAHRRLPQFEGRSSERTWLYSIARHVALRVRRGELRRDRKVRAFAEHQGASAGGSSVFDGLSPRIDAEQVLSRFLNTLDLGQRQAFTLHALEGRSDREIAELLHIKLSTARARWRLAKAKFSAFSEGMREELAQVDRLSRGREAEIEPARQRCWMVLAPTWTATDWGAASMGTASIQAKGLLSASSMVVSKLGVAKAAGAGLGFGLGLTVSVAVGELLATERGRASEPPPGSHEVATTQRTSDEGAMRRTVQPPRISRADEETKSPKPTKLGPQAKSPAARRRSRSTQPKARSSKPQPKPAQPPVTTRPSDTLGKSTLEGQLALTTQLRDLSARGDYTGVLRASRAWQTPTEFAGLDTEICAYRAAAYCKTGSEARGRALARRCVGTGALGRATVERLRRSCER